MAKTETGARMVAVKDVSKGKTRLILADFHPNGDKLFMVQRRSDCGFKVSSESVILTRDEQRRLIKMLVDSL